MPFTCTGTTVTYIGEGFEEGLEFANVTDAQMNLVASYFKWREESLTYPDICCIYQLSTCCDGLTCTTAGEDCYKIEYLLGRYWDDTFSCYIWKMSIDLSNSLPSMDQTELGCNRYSGPNPAYRPIEMDAVVGSGGMYINPTIGICGTVPSLFGDASPCTIQMPAGLSEGTDDEPRGITAWYEDNGWNKTDGKNFPAMEYLPYSSFSTSSMPADTTVNISDMCTGDTLNYVANTGVGEQLIAKFRNLVGSAPGNTSQTTQRVLSAKANNTTTKFKGSLYYGDLEAVRITFNSNTLTSALRNKTYQLQPMTIDGGYLVYQTTTAMAAVPQLNDSFKWYLRTGIGIYEYDTNRSQDLNDFYSDFCTLGKLNHGTKVSIYYADQAEMDGDTVGFDIKEAEYSISRMGGISHYDMKDDVIITKVSSGAYGEDPTNYIATWHVEFPTVDYRAANAPEILDIDLSGYHQDGRWEIFYPNPFVEA